MMLSEAKNLTPETAAAYRYGQWSGNPRGCKYIQGQCAMGVWSKGRWTHEFQCSRQNGHGKDGLFCKQHAKMMEPTEKGSQ